MGDKNINRVCPGEQGDTVECFGANDETTDITVGL